MDSTITDEDPTAIIAPAVVAFEANLRDTEASEVRVFEDGDPVELD